jgi:heme-degrading monooxygenase HmoA
LATKDGNVDIEVKIFDIGGTKRMILEAAQLNVQSGQEKQFEAAFQEASKIIARTPGYIMHQLHRCLEVPGKYLLLVQWRDLESHTVGFRQSEQYQEWKRLLHHFYHPFPVVEHFEAIHP